MTSNFYKQVAISQSIVSGWILYAFFDYLAYSDEVIFRGLALFSFFYYSSILISGIGFILVLMRLLWFYKKRKEILTGKFIYVFAGIFNAYLTIIWIITLAMGLMKINSFTAAYLLVPLFVAVIIMKDFYKLKAKEISDTVIETVE